MISVRFCLQFLNSHGFQFLLALKNHYAICQASVMNVDRYAAAESFYKLAMAYAPVPDLHIMWLLHLCDAHQEMQSWAEAAQCAVAVAGVIMQVCFWFMLKLLFTRLPRYFPPFSDFL